MNIKINNTIVMQYKYLIKNICHQNIIKYIYIGIKDVKILEHRFSNRYIKIKVDIKIC